MPNMQMFELSPNDKISLLTREPPLDSTAIDPKNWSPKHYETGKKETLSRKYLFLVYST
jgi:hypothetical protein